MEKPVVLRVCNWEDNIDEGGWEDDELIDLPSEDIFGENSLVPILKSGITRPMEFL